MVLTLANELYGERESYLQDSLIYKIEDPFLPTIRPIFSAGTVSTDNVSCSGAFPSLKKSGRGKHIILSIKSMIHTAPNL